MDEEKRRCESRISAAAILPVPDLPECALRHDENQDAVQKVEQKIDEVIAPDFLSRPHIIETKEHEQKRSRTREIKIGETNGWVHLDRRQIVEYQWNRKGIEVSGDGDRS